MRTIKFKAKRQDNGQWVIGDLLQHLDGDVLIGDNTGPWTDCGYSHCDYSQLYKVDPTTVCQFTGLTDKNGKEIYEYDILAHNGKNIGFVANDMRCYCFDLVCTNTANTCTVSLHDTVVNDHEGDVEIIGNINDDQKGG